MSSPEAFTGNPEDLLWEVAFACAERRTGLETELAVEHDRLANLSVCGMGLIAQEKFADDMAAFAAKHSEAIKVSEFEEAVLGVLQRVTDGEATDDEIQAYLPQEPSPNSSPSKRKLALAAERQRSGLDPRDDFFGTLSWNLIYGADPGRLTTGRNRRRIVTNGRIGGIAAIHMFDELTADTHGGKVRNAGKDGRYYTTSSGKRIRKY